jgi:hypothetical protein
VSQAAANLLKSKASADFQAKLARQLGKLAFFGQRLGENGIPQDADAEKYAARLNKLKDLLASIASLPPARGKKHDKAASKLRAARKELQK